MLMAMSHHPPSHPNGSQGRDDSSITSTHATINPMALNTPEHQHRSHQSPQNISSPRGIKRRSRSPDDLAVIEHEEDKPRKRGRPPKSLKVNGSPAPSYSEAPSHTPHAQTPSSAHHATEPLVIESPVTTPTKPLKALPTVRDHTSDILNPEKDEFIIKETDEAGEKKVAPNGAPLGGRQYRVRVFLMPGRGDKLFMLATECAKVLSYRDSYLLFNKNRSLFKIIANQEEKNDLIHQGILPASYRSRQIAIVSARSMFRQFGSRMIHNGKRVRDDYFEARAIAQGFTEDDPAGEKRPGAGKAAREAAAAVASDTHSPVLSLPHGKIMYQPTEHSSPIFNNSLVNLDPPRTQSDFGEIHKVRQDIPPNTYDDRIQPVTTGEMMAHIGLAAEYSQNLTTQRNRRADYLNDIWTTPHEPATPDSGADDNQAVSSTTSHIPLPHGTALNTHQQHFSPQQQHAQPQHHMMTPQQPYPHGLQGQMLNQSPSRPSHQISHAGIPTGVNASYPFGYANQPAQQRVYGAGLQQQQQQIHHGGLHQAGMQFPGIQQSSPHMTQQMHPGQIHTAQGMQGFNTANFQQHQPQHHQNHQNQQHQQQQQQQQHLHSQQQQPQQQFLGAQQYMQGQPGQYIQPQQPGHNDQWVGNTPQPPPQF